MTTHIIELLDECDESELRRVAFEATERLITREMARLQQDITYLTARVGWEDHPGYSVKVGKGGQVRSYRHPVGHDQEGNVIYEWRRETIR